MDLHSETHTSSIFGKKASPNSRRSGLLAGSAGTAPQSPQCPECASRKTWKDGLRYSVTGDTMQRWLCRNCGYRFSDPSVKFDVSGQVVKVPNSKSDHLQKRVAVTDLAREKGPNSLPFGFREDLGSHKVTGVGKVLNTFGHYNSNRQICVTETKNLAIVEKEERKELAAAIKPDQLTKKGLLLQYEVYLDKEGYGKESRYPTFIRMLLNTPDCNIYDPENVKEAISKKNWKNGTKMLCCYAYDALTKMLGLTWTMPTYHQEKYIFFLPEEAELDVLINATRSQRMRTYLQTLKEIWSDPSEGLRLRWIDVDTNRSMIIINRPVKDHYPREIEVSARLLAMINNLPKVSTLIFPMTYRTMYGTFKKLRKRVAYNTQNPRILSISPVSFRHWGGTMLAWLSNGNVPFVQEKLGHKNVQNTMKYIKRTGWKLIQDFEVVTACTDEEIKKYGEAGYQKYDERTVGATHISYYRRPKRFGNLKV